MSSRKVGKTGALNLEFQFVAKDHIRATLDGLYAEGDISKTQGGKKSIAFSMFDQDNYLPKRMFELIVVRENTKLVGLLSLGDQCDPVTPMLIVQSVYTLPNHRRRGIARKVIEQVLKKYKKDNRFAHIAMRANSKRMCQLLREYFKKEQRDGTLKVSFEECSVFDGHIQKVEG